MQGKKGKNAWLATGLTVAGVVLLLGALAALPEGVYWLPEALAEATITGAGCCPT